MDDIIDNIKESIDRAIIFEPAIFVVELALFLIDSIVFVENKQFILVYSLLIDLKIFEVHRFLHHC
jgi:hypothetical protein